MATNATKKAALDTYVTSLQTCATNRTAFLNLVAADAGNPAAPKAYDSIPVGRTRR